MRGSMSTGLKGSAGGMGILVGLSWLTAIQIEPRHAFHAIGCCFCHGAKVEEPARARAHKPGGRGALPY